MRYFANSAAAAFAHVHVGRVTINLQDVPKVPDVLSTCIDARKIYEKSSGLRHDIDSCPTCSISEKILLLSLSISFENNIVYNFWLYITTFFSNKNSSVIIDNFSDGISLTDVSYRFDGKNSTIVFVVKRSWHFPTVVRDFPSKLIL